MILNGKSSQEFPVNVGFLQGSIHGPTLFLLDISDLPDDVICDIAIYADNTTLCCKCDQEYLIFGNNLNWLLNMKLTHEKLWTGAGGGLLISMLEKLNWFCFTDLMTLVLLMWKWMGQFLRKNLLLRCWSWISLLNWIEAGMLSLLLKLPPKKLES